MKETDFEAVELPYRSNLFSMVILLPRQTDGCGALEQRLTPALVSNSVAEMKKQKVEIFLPRFRLQSSLQLKRALVEMGMTDAFGSKADFSGMDETHQLSISAVFHQSWGEVNEEGTEAAAATAAGIHATAVIRPPQPPSVFKADHPFLFFIRDTRSGALLFLGRLENPQQQ
jgi:serpin B